MEQTDLFGKPIAQIEKPTKKEFTPKTGLNVVDGGEFIYYPDYFNKEDSDRYLDVLINSIVWRQDSMKMYGKELKFPRLTAWYGNGDKSYTFSGTTLPAKVWTPELLEIKGKIDAIGKVDFNSVLLNRYRTGDDWISWHQDDEKELGKNPVIGSVNFGATRRFMLRRVDDHKEKIEIPLKHGSLLVMSGALQHTWQHQVPKEKTVNSERLNLTFRVIH